MERSHHGCPRHALFLSIEEYLSTFYSVLQGQAFLRYKRISGKRHDRIPQTLLRIRRIDFPHKSLTDSNSSPIDSSTLGIQRQLGQIIVSFCIWQIAMYRSSFQPSLIHDFLDRTPLFVQFLYFSAVFRTIISRGDQHLSNRQRGRVQCLCDFPDTWSCF